MFRTITKDIKRYSGESKLAILRVLLFEHTFHLVFWIRLGTLLRKIPILGRLLGITIEYFIRVFYSSDISCKAQIGAGLMIVHGQDIVIGAKSVIGENCKIFNGVTMGGKNTEIAEEGQPVVGNNVVISTGAKVLGSLTIGDNCIIGANSVVVKSFGSNLVIAGVPAKVIRSK